MTPEALAALRAQRRVNKPQFVGPDSARPLTTAEVDQRIVKNRRRAAIGAIAMRGRR